MRDLADSVEQSVAAVDERCYEGTDESLRRLPGEHTADLADVAQVKIRTTADAVHLHGPACSGACSKQRPGC